MKISIAIAVFLSIFSTSLFAQPTLQKDTLKVWGNCTMCKKTIEQSAKSAGAVKASWNKETKQLTVSYPLAKSSNAAIQQAIAKAGYDTRDFNADNKAYEALSPCCQYDRKEPIAPEQ